MQRIRPRFRRRRVEIQLLPLQSVPVRGHRSGPIRHSVEGHADSKSSALQPSANASRSTSAFPCTPFCKPLPSPRSPTAHPSDYTPRNACTSCGPVDSGRPSESPLASCHTDDVDRVRPPPNAAPGLLRTASSATSASYAPTPSTPAPCQIKVPPASTLVRWHDSNPPHGSTPTFPPCADAASWTAPARSNWFLCPPRR